MAPPFQLNNITRSSIQDAIPSPFFGLEDALNDNYSTPSTSFKSPSLFPNACNQTDGSHNCTFACTNQNLLFASLDTLHNCVVWPSVLANEATITIPSESNDLAKSLGVFAESGRSNLPSEISQNIQDCMLQSCDDDKECAAHANAVHAPDGFRKLFDVNLNGSMYYRSKNLPYYFNPCQHINNPAIADIAGIGVFISYVMQMGLVLIAFIMAIPWRRTARRIRRTSRTAWRKMTARKRQPEEQKQETSTSALSPPTRNETPKPRMTFNPTAAITPFIVEFHKAQCYFMLATNIAGLIVQTSGGLNPKSLQQLYNTYVFLKVVAIGGYLPITFGLLVLRMIRKVSWYLLALSVASVAMAIGDLYSPRNFSPSIEDLDALRDVALMGGPPVCGGNSPIAWCYNRISIKSGYSGFGYTNEGDGANDFLVVSLITLALVVIDHFWNSPDPTNQRIKHVIFRPAPDSTIANSPSKWSKTLHWLGKWVVPILFTILIIIYLYCLAYFALDLNWFREYKIYDPSWSFGQIVAISVWVPPIFEYFWESFRGIEDANDHRLPDGYEVRKRED